MLAPNSYLEDLFLSTQLIFQLIYDDNAVSRLQVREVFGIGAQLKLN